MISSMGIAMYWPFLVVCIGGIILAVIAFLALLLLRNQEVIQKTREKMKSVFSGRNKKNSSRKCGSAVQVSFYRIGLCSEVKSKMLETEQWISVGSGKNADFCLNSDDRKMADIHFRMCVSDAKLMISPLEKETFVNGVPIRQLGTVSLESGDLIRAGGCEYRVIIVSCEEKGSFA